jgi:hypothetical protein
MTLRAAAEQALDTLEHVQAHIGRYDPPVVTTIARAMQPTIDALRAALAAEQPQPEAQPVVELMREADAIVRAKPTWKRYIDGTPLSNDIAVWMVDFARQHAPPPAAEPSEAELPPLPIGEAEVVWHEPDPVMPERPGKIIDASIAFFDAAPLGTHLYTAEQMRDYALRAAAAARKV